MNKNSKDCTIDAGSFTEIFLYFLEKMGFSDDGYPPDVTVVGHVTEHGRYVNNVFELSAFWWNECTCGKEPNQEMLSGPDYHKDDCMVYVAPFVYKPTGFKMDWYKSIGRDMKCNKEINLEEFWNIMMECYKSIGIRERPFDIKIEGHNDTYIISMDTGDGNIRTIILKKNIDNFEEFQKQVDMIITTVKNALLNDSIS